MKILTRSLSLPADLVIVNWEVLSIIELTHRVELLVVILSTNFVLNKRLLGLLFRCHEVLSIHVLFLFNFKL